MRFSSHYKMTEDDVIDFVFEHTKFFENNENLVCEEIGDGNINYIYRIRDTKNSRSIILKQADVCTRVRPDGYLNPARNLHEAAVLQTQFELAGNLVPEVFFINEDMACFVMEDIGSYSNLRTELMSGKIFPALGSSIARFIVKTALPLTAPVFNSEKKPCENTVSKDLCKITENLVFTHPYKNIAGRNILLKENEKWLEEKFYGNEELLIAAAELKEEFKTHPQSLIHGDLHSGSIFVKAGAVNEAAEIKVIDPEFAFYGPIAYDLGNACAHFVFASVYSEHTAQKETSKKFCEYCKITIKELIEEFMRFGKEYLLKSVKDPIFKNEKFLYRFLEKIKEDASRFAGAELNRRVIGSAKVPELTRLEDINKRISAERKLAETGIKLMTKKDFRFCEDSEFWKIF